MRTASSRAFYWKLDHWITQFESFDWLSHHGLWAIIPCSTNTVSIRLVLARIYFDFSLAFHCCVQNDICIVHSPFHWHNIIYNFRNTLVTRIRTPLSLMIWSSQSRPSMFEFFHKNGMDTFRWEWSCMAATQVNICCVPYNCVSAEMSITNYLRYL